MDVLGEIGCLEMSGNNYKHMLCIILEEQRPHILILWWTVNLSQGFPPLYHSVQSKLLWPFLGRC